MYAAAGGASLASRQKRKNQAAQNVKNKALLQQGLKDKLAAARASNLAPKAQSRQFHNLPPTYLRAPQAHVRKLSAGYTTQSKILLPINESNNQYFAHFHNHHHLHAHEHPSLVHEHHHHRPLSPRPSTAHLSSTRRLTKSATASIPLASQYEITPPESPSCLLKPHPPLVDHFISGDTLKGNLPCIVTPATPLPSPGPTTAEQLERKCSFHRGRKQLVYEENLRKEDIDNDDEYHVKHKPTVLEKWTDSECCDSEHQISICTCDHIENFQIECDAISNTDFGRRFCFIRHLKNKTIHNVTYKFNSIAEEKREIIFDNCTLDELPWGMFQNFPNVKTMYVWNIQLKRVKKEVFQNANQLTLLDLSKNHIGMLHQNSFALAKYLTQLDLSTNLIESIHVDAFSGLESLAVLNLQNNKLQLIPSNSFVELISLRTIRMSHNLIKMIPVELFGQNIQLEKIYLNDNAIEWMSGEQTFRHLHQVNEFDLHNNPNANLGCCIVNAESIDIRKTSSKGCYIGSRTKRVLANDNRISAIDSSDANPTNVEHVDFANNRLQKMNNLSVFKNLKYLDLTNNGITDISLNSFSDIKQLEVLMLRNSGLSKIHFGLFSHKSKLRTLDISYNKLNTLDFRMFVSMSNLTELQLEGNNLKEMDASEIRKIFPVLAKIGISANNWTCQSLSLVVKHLEEYGIAFNSDGPQKTLENIKGIPCSSGIEMSIPNDSVEIMISTSKPAVVQPTSNESNRRLLDISDVNLMLRILELKYDVQYVIQSCNDIAKNLEEILNNA